MITSGEKAGQHDQERITAQIQVIPSDDFNQYGDRKVAGFTLTEIARIVETGVGQTILINPEDPDSAIVARIAVGDGIDQFTLPELRQIIKEMGGTVLSTPSPLDDKDRLRVKLERDLEPPNRGGRPKKNAVVTNPSADGPASSGPTDSEDSTA